MKTYVDVATESLIKYGEELCGDNVEIRRNEDEVLAVLSDGLGSGVKANILANLTSKIAITMLDEGADINETVDTIVNTLPECQVRKLAYSTFTIIKIDSDLNLYVAEYDSPPFFIYRNGKMMDIEKKESIINNKKIYETKIKLLEGDTIGVVSDGVIHAGVGALLNLGWQWKDVNSFLLDVTKKEKSANAICGHLMNMCRNLYDDKPGDDTTGLILKVRNKECVNIFTGPPSNPEDDEFVVRHFMKKQGLKIVCGGTTANIFAKYLDEKLEVDITTMTKDIPPMAKLRGIDLVTEGILTLKETLDIISNYDKILEQNKKNKNAALMLAKVLMEDCTHLRWYVGSAVNPAHMNPDLPIDFNFKKEIIKKIANELEKTGKTVDLTFI